MRDHRLRGVVGAVAVLLGLGAALVGCGGGSSEDLARPAPSATRFPVVEGRKLAEIAAVVDESSYVVSPTGLTFDPGVNRYAFGVFTLGKKQVTDAEVALYFARGAEGEAAGPFPARIEPLSTRPAYRSRGTSLDPEATKVVYVVPRVELSGNGEWRVLAVFRTADGLEGTLVRSISAGDFPAVPNPGDKAPRIETPTIEDVGGDLSKIDTRNPPDQMHRVDFGDAFGKRPIALLFSTPAFCESRVCGPVVDIAEEVNGDLGDEVAFIHMEVYQQNDPGEDIRPQLRAFGLATEPWMFVIDRRGKVSARFEGGFSAAELRRAVERVSP